MVKATYHQRDLPSPAIDFASDEGKKLLNEAIKAKTMEGFYKLMNYFQTQSELTYCGLASLSMVLNALHVDPGRTWKAPWRWFDESMLDCREQLEKVKAKGISFRKVAFLAERAGAEVKAFQTSQTNVDIFRQSVKECSSSDNCHVVSSYHRAVLKQAGTGHFSPIGGYHEGSDMVLILDVARFKYPCHWAPLALLWKAMDTIDETTDERRGFMLISKPKRDAGLLDTLKAVESCLSFSLCICVMCARTWRDGLYISHLRLEELFSSNFLESSCKNESWVGVVRNLMDEVESDASDHATGGVLMQDEHPVAFEYQKLNDAEQQYTVQEKVDPNSVTEQISQAITELLNIASRLYCHCIKKGLKHDQRAQNLVGYAQEGQFQLEDDFYTKGQRPKVPLCVKLRKEVLHECHDSKWAWPSSKTNATGFIEDQCYGPQMRDDLEAYRKTSLVCQQDKLKQQSSPRLLKPLPIPTRPWESVSMNFIMNLPKFKECEILMVVVDQFSKYSIFVPVKKHCPAKKAAKLFFKHVVKNWGVPQIIMSDSDPQFREHFRTELFKLLGSKLNFSISLHLQTDSMERVNALLEIYFRHYVSTRQANWVKLIDVAQFSYNSQQSEFTGQSPLEIVIRQQPQTPSTGVSGLAACLLKASKHMKKWADKKCKHVKFQVGDLVWVRLHMNLRYKDVHKELNRRGPFRVSQRVGNFAYKLALPLDLQVHPVFHISMLNPYKEDLD